MENKVVLGVLVLLTFLRVVFVGAMDGSCCDWWTESVEWPVGASQCPATLDGANATYCCGLCYASHHSSFEEAWLDGDACPNEDELPVSSGSSSYSDKPGFFAPALALIVPAVFLILFFCAWLWIKDEHGAPGNVSDPVGGSSSSFVRSRLQSRYLPPHYGACSMPDSLEFTMNTQELQDLACPSGDTRVQFYQPTGEDDVILTPLVIPGAPEEAASGGAPEEAASGGAPEEAASGGAPEEAASGGAPEEAASGGAPEETASPTE